jgi:hypothetical protein
MAAASYSVLTNSGVNKVWRKVQGDLQTALNFECEEWELLDEQKEFDIDWSAREITVPIDINEGAGVASIGEGADEARPSSPNAEELTLSWILLNKRFTISKTARWIDEKNRDAMIERQIVFQGMHAVRDIQRTFSDYFYGFSTGLLAKTDTDLSGGTDTLTLKDGYGMSDIDTASYLAAMFKPGDAIMVHNAGTLVTGAIGTIDAGGVSSANGTLAVTWTGTPSDSTNGLSIVKANSLENTTLASGSDKDRGLVGVLDGMTSSSVHSLSTSTAPNWDVAYSDTASGRFSGIKLHRAKQEIANEGGGVLNLVLMDQGVERDLLSQYQAGVRFADSFALEIDGAVKSKGVKFFTSRRVPPGYVFCMDKKSFRKMSLLPKPGQPAWEDAYKLQDKSGYIFSLDFPCQLVHTNRKNYAYFSSQTTA